MFTRTAPKICLHTRSYDARKKRSERTHKCKHKHTHTHTYTYLQASTHKYAYTYIHVLAHTHVNKHACTRAWTHARTHAHTHTHTHIYYHICTQANKCTQQSYTHMYTSGGSSKMLPHLPYQARQKLHLQPKVLRCGFSY
jgi:hypothetical protein